MKFTPLFDKVVVKRAAAKEKSFSGLYIPDEAKDRPLEGVVVRTGCGKRLDDGRIADMLVHEGDKVLFGKYAGTEIKLDNEDYLILREDEVIGVL